MVCNTRKGPLCNLRTTQALISLYGLCCPLTESVDIVVYVAKQKMSRLDSTDAHTGPLLSASFVCCASYRKRYVSLVLILTVLGPVVQSIVSLTSLLRVILLTVLADSIYNIDIFCWKYVSSCKSYSHFFSKKFQHICVSLDVNFNESLTNNIVSFEQLDPGMLSLKWATMS